MMNQKKKIIAFKVIHYILIFIMLLLIGFIQESYRNREKQFKILQEQVRIYDKIVNLDVSENNRKTELLNFVSSLNGHLTIYDSPYGIGLGGWCWITAIYTLFYISIARLFRKYIDRLEIKTDKDRQA